MDAQRITKVNEKAQKKAYDRAKRTRLTQHWDKYKKLRNVTTNLLRTSKKAYFDNIADKLKSDSSISSKDWWKTLKTFVSSHEKASVPPLKANDIINAEDKDKVNLFNSYFKTQSDLNDSNKTVPQISRLMTKPAKWHVRPAKTRISLGILFGLRDNNK